MAPQHPRSSEISWSDEVGLFPLFLTLILPLVIGVIILLKCVYNQCCLRKSTPKEEMFGVEGRMTILSNADSSLNVNNNTAFGENNGTIGNYRNSSTAPGHNLHKALNVTKSNGSSNKRLSSISTSSAGEEKKNAEFSDGNDLAGSLKRSAVRALPDIPPPSSNPPRRSSSLLSHDGTSELYATVEELPSGSSKNNTKQVKTSTLETNPSSDSETYGPLSSSTHHPYAKLSKLRGVEHPYARVLPRSSGVEEETESDNYDALAPPPYSLLLRGNGESEESPSSSTPPLHPPPPPTSSNNESIISGGGGESAPIPPRRAGRGGRLNTAPHHHHHHHTSNTLPNISTNTNEPQVHFSGDSQDSRGYTSISVREPLSNIRTQQQVVPALRRNESLYATVSDDSEEMYAAIEDGDGSYMRISEDQRNNRHERREANSPLPPVPPPISPIMLPENSPLTPTPSPQPPIYAQVTKAKKSKSPHPPSQNPTTDPHPPPGNSKRRQFNILEMSEGESSGRRWSKADISYSEFEVVREANFSNSPLFPDNNDNSHPSTTTQELDEDNYNVIEEKAKPISMSSKSTTSALKKIPTTDDYYQEISEVKKLKRDNVYSKIQRKRGESKEGDESDDEDEDEFYEKVNKKHGYEKIKPKGGGGGVSRNEKEVSEDDEGGMYEQVRYAPSDNLYEDIGYSQINKRVASEKSYNSFSSSEKHSLEINKNKQSEKSNYDKKFSVSEKEYRENASGSSMPIYSQVKKTKVKKPDKLEKGQGDKLENKEKAQEERDLSELYARIDKGKKKKKNSLEGVHPLHFNNDEEIEYI